MRRKADKGNKVLHDNNVWSVQDHYSYDGVHTYYELSRGRGPNVIYTKTRSDRIDLVARDR